MTTPKAFSFRGLRPLTRGSAPGPRWGHSPQTPIIGSRSALAIWPPPNCTPGSAPGRRNSFIRSLTERNNIQSRQGDCDAGQHYNVGNICMDLYSAMSYTQGAHTWITQFYLQTTPMPAFTPQPQSITALWLVLILPSHGG